MSLLNKKILQDLDIQLNSGDEEKLSKHFETTLNDRVTTEIVEGLTPAQLEELQAMKSKPDEDLQVWLAKNVPDLKEIVEDEVAILLGEIAEGSDKF